MRALNSWVRCAFVNIFVFCVILYFDQDQDGHISVFWVFFVFWPRPRWTYFCILSIFVFWPRPRWTWRRAWSRGRGWRRGGKGSEWVSTSFLGKNFCKQEINSFLLVSYQKMPTKMLNEKKWAQAAYFLGEKVLEERVQIICWGNQVIH